MLMAVVFWSLQKVLFNLLRTVAKSCSIMGAADIVLEGGTILDPIHLIISLQELLQPCIVAE